MIRLLTFLTSALVLAAPQDPAADPLRERIAAAVAATGLHHEASASGASHVLRYDHDGNRQQRVYVSARAGTAGARRMVTVYTTVWHGTEPPSDDLLRKVFTNCEKFGSYYLFAESDGSWSIRFADQVDVTTLPDRPAPDDPVVARLRATIEFVDQVGEATDKDLNGDRDAG